MRNKIAKKLRRKVYGDRSRRNPYDYYRRNLEGTIVCTGLRGDYLEEKSAFKRGEE